MMTHVIIELVTYRLQANVSKAQLAAIQDTMNAFLTQQEGFIYRSMSEDESGLFYDIVYWKDMPSAKQASAAFEANTACQKCMKLVDETTVTIQYMEALSETEVCQHQS